MMNVGGVFIFLHPGPDFGLVKVIGNLTGIVTSELRVQGSSSPPWLRTNPNPAQTGLVGFVLGFSVSQIYPVLYDSRLKSD